MRVILMPVGVFTRLTRTGLMGSPRTSVIYEVFSILVWVGLVLGTKTRKKTSPIQVNFEFPLASVSRNTVPARGKQRFGLNSIRPGAEVLEKGAPSGDKRIYISVDRRFRRVRPSIEGEFTSPYPLLHRARQNRIFKIVKTIEFLMLFSTTLRFTSTPRGGVPPRFEVNLRFPRAARGNWTSSAGVVSSISQL